MKKYLLLILGLSFPILHFAQSKTSTEMLNKTINQDNSIKSLDFSLIPMGSASDVFTMLNSLQNQVDYNPDLNMMTFVHRQNINLTPDGGTGTIRFDYSTDAGVNWNINQGPLNNDLVAADGHLEITTTVGQEVAAGLRNPNGAIFNPPGNTELNNAFYVTASASRLDDGGFGHIGVSCFTATNLGDMNPPSEQYLQAVSDNTWSGDYFQYGLTQGGDAMYSVSSLFFTTGTLENYSKLAIWKGVLNNDQTDFDWSATVLEPNFVTYTANDGSGDFESLMTSDHRSIAFSPDGLVGYMVVLGSLESYSENLSRPIAYKTIDAGQNWVLQPELDIVSMPISELVEYTEGSNTIRRPVVESMEIVVDANGTLHVLSEMNRGTPTDGEAFSWVDINTEISNTFFIDFTLNTNGEWNSQYIGEPINIDEGIPDIGWISFYTIKHEFQASRSADGNKVFFSWLASPLSSDQTNVEPDIFARGLDVMNNTWTAIKNLTFDTDIESIVNIASLAPTCITNGEEFDYELPYVIIEDFVLGFGEETFFTHVKGLGFNEEEFHPLAVNEIHPLVQDFKVWPNPAQNNTTVNFNLLENAKVQVSVFTVTGQKVKELLNDSLSLGKHKIDLSLNDFKPGLYFVTLSINKAKYTQKLVIH